MSLNLNEVKNKLAEEGLDFTTYQVYLLENAKVSHDSEINQMRIIADMYMISRYQKMVDNLIESNERLGKSNEKQARSLVWATWVLAFATFGLIIVEILPRILGWK